MVQLIHSEVDADGIDYIMRDSSFSGTSYGGFELGLLLRNLRVDKYNGIDIVGVRPKGISVVDQYLISKYFSYTQVIFNKHVSILGVMAEMLTHALVRLDASTYPTAESLQKYIDLHSKGNDTFLKFTDRTFWAQLDLIDAQKQLKGIVPDHVLKIFECLSEYRELPSSENRETVVTSSDISSVSETLKQTEIYKDLVDEKEDKLVLFHERGFTAQIPQEMFKDKLIGLNGKEIEDDEFKRSNTARLQEGVAIISKGEEVKLLVDDDRSMMSHLYNTKTYILREYDVNK